MRKIILILKDISMICFLIRNILLKSKKYPELIKIAQDMWYDITKEINKRVKNVKSDMPYKAQYVLEELIKRLQKSV